MHTLGILLGAAAGGLIVHFYGWGALALVALGQVAVFIAILGGKK